jgi:hypothetical protein
VATWALLTAAAQSATNAPVVRAWASKQGSSLEAEFVKADGGLVELKKPDGKIVSIALTALRDEDQAFVKALTAASPAQPGQPSGPEVPPPEFIPTPKIVTLGHGSMPLKPRARIVATDPRLKPLAEVLSDEILLLTDIKMMAVAGAPAPGDIVLRINPGIRADADIVAVQPKAGAALSPTPPVAAQPVKGKKPVAPAKPVPRMEVVRTRDLAHTIDVGDMAVVEGWDYRATAEGTATLLQAITEQAGEYLIPAMKIKDWPQADFTGIMLDCGRQWMSPQTIKVMIESCRIFKTRYLHLHLSDDHGYTMPSRAFPELGSRNIPISDGITCRTYTWEELNDLEAYAVARGVTLVPELETPGHSEAMRRARNDVFGGPGCMNMAAEYLYDGLDKVIGEMCEVFKSTPYFHIGGDEVDYHLVGDQPQDQIYMKNHPLPGSKEPLKNPHDIYLMHFIRLAEMVRKRGKIAMVWEGFGDHDALKDEVVVMTWYSGGYAAGMESRGFAVVTVPWEAGPLPQWSMYTCNGHTYGRQSRVLGASRPMWQMSQFTITDSWCGGPVERSERTWGPDTPMPDEAAYRKRMEVKTDRMKRLAMPARIVVKPADKKSAITGMTHFLQGWWRYTGTVDVSIEPLFPRHVEIRYTLDGNDPDMKSAIYRKPLSMSGNFTLKAALFYNKRMIGSVSSVNYVK